MMRTIAPAGAAIGPALAVPIAATPAATVPDPEAVAHAQALLVETHLWLLRGNPADAVIQAAALAALALGVIAGEPADLHAELVPVIATLYAARATGALGQALADARWLDRVRRAVEPFAGQVCSEHDADARRALEIATRLARDAGLVTVQQAVHCQTDAERRASAPAPSALHWLDRDDQRQVLLKRLASQPRVLVVLVHGEAGQGHEHFAEIVTTQVRSAASGWRELAVAWPPRTRPLEMRLATLIEALSRRLGLAFDRPDGAPSDRIDPQAWRPALDRIVDAIHRASEPMLLRHVVGRLAGGSRGDCALLDAYLALIWNAVARRAARDPASPGRPGEPVRRHPPLVVSLDLRRVESGGFPLTSPWWHARRDLATVRAIIRVLGAHHLTHGAICVALPELTSVPPDEVADWLCHHAGLDHAAAQIEARALVAETRGGRFDQVLQRLTADLIDPPRKP